MHAGADKSSAALLDDIWIVPILGGSLGRFISGGQTHEQSPDAFFLRGDFQDVAVLRELLGPCFKGGVVNPGHSDALKGFVDVSNIMSPTPTSISRLVSSLLTCFQSKKNHEMSPAHQTGSILLCMWLDASFILKNCWFVCFGDRPSGRIVVVFLGVGNRAINTAV